MPTSTGPATTRSARPNQLPKARRTQADRRADTQARIIAATTTLLQTDGYAATTIQRVARAAGVSLGALQHHYPTKALLMATVLRHYAVKRAMLYRRALRGVHDVEARADAILDAMWQLVIEGPAFIATVEIELARRSDPDLHVVTEPVLARIDQFMTRWLARTEKPQASFTRMRVLTATILRGFAVEIARGTPVTELAEAYAMWRRLSREEMLALATPATEEDR